MCGFAGFLDLTRATGSEALAADARTMAAALHHRGPDDGGVWVDAEVGVALGHRRLSIVDLSPEGHQPMLSADGRSVLVFNGEIYNFRELRRELEPLGHGFRGHSDTEVLLAAMRQWGVEAAVRRSVGMFAFALWDRAERTLWLGRDRMGEKPLYYGESGGHFLFGSELKALRAHPRWRSEIDRDALALFMRFCYVPAPFSIYRGIRKLIPGTLLRFAPDRSARPEETAYWSLRDVAERGVSQPFDGTPQEGVDALEALLSDAVSRQMLADVPLGAFLSGGIDSSTVVALMQAVSSRPVRTFTIGFPEKAYDEAHFAAGVARHLGTDHTELYVTPEETRAVIPRLPEIYDEPFADSSQIPTFLVSRMARQHVTVSLSGDGGDELFGGYNRYFLGARIWDRVQRVPRPLREVGAGALRLAPPGAWDWLGTRLAWAIPRNIRHPQLAQRARKLADVLASPHPEAVYQRLVASWLETAALVKGSVEPATLVSDPGAWPDLEAFPARMMYLDSATYLPDDILVKVDRAAMAVSLETRVPMLDHRVVEFAWKLPLGMKINGGRGKWALRQVLSRYVPPALVERQKQGFGIPLDHWLIGPLREWTETLLDERRVHAEGYLSARPVRDIWRRHQAGERNTLYPLWCVLMFQSWLEHTEGIAPASAAPAPAAA